MSNIAISFENVSKMYRLGLVGTGTLGQDLNRWWKMSILHQEDPYLKIGQTNDRSTKGSSDFVFALKDINFQVEQGDVIGIIGKNGAGKSTLLKLLSRITAPSTGMIKTRGRLASLLEVGTGFHPELTGRENIYMNGSIMGMTKSEINSKLDEIIDFAGVERYIDTPCKRYSSGMQVRLGFAVAAFLEPEILVVDEVLAVGDVEFQKKAIGKMQDVSSTDGRTVLFVSHNMNSVRLLCKKGVVLKNGMIEYTGTANECVDFYSETNIQDLIRHRVVTPDMRNKIKDNYMHEVNVQEATMINDNKEVSTDEDLQFEIKLHRNNSNINEVQVVVTFSNEEDINIMNYITAPLEIKNDDVTVNMTLQHHGLPKGKYNVQFATGKKDYSQGSRNYDVISKMLSFEVKYTHQSTKAEFFAWDRKWACVLHENDNVIATIK